MDTAARCGVPIATLDVFSSERIVPYRHKLLLSGPDRHVAWRSDSIPHEPGRPIDLVRGANSA